MNATRSGLLALATVLAVLGFSATAEAYRVRVWYDHAGAPAGYSRDDMHTLINYAIREWEEHSDGRVIHRLAGDVTPGTRVAGSGNLTIVWDAGLTGLCGQAWGYCPTWPNTCTIALNPTRWSTPLRSAPAAGSGPNGCGDTALGTLMHEFGHHIRQDMGHPDNSVLGTNSTNAIDRFGARHVWNGDMDSVSWIVYPASEVRLAYEEIDASGNVALTASPIQGTASGEYGNYVASIGTGQNGSAYYRASALARDDGATFLSRAVIFERSNGNSLTSWGNRRTITVPGGAAATTRHHTCVAASTTSQDVYVVFANGEEFTRPAFNAFDAGTRAVMFSESHDGGNTWAPAQAIPLAFTRSGVSCAFDRALGRVVVGYSGSGEEAVWTTHRVASAAGASAWATPTRIDAPETSPAFRVFSPHPPQISFDPFTNEQGVMAWFDWLSFSHRIERLAFNAGANRYQFAPPPGTVHQRATNNDVETSRARSPIVPSRIGSLMPWAFSFGAECSVLGCPAGRSEQDMMLVRRRPASGTLAPPWTDATTLFISPAASDFQTYGDAAANAVTVRNAYLRYVLINSL